MRHSRHESANKCRDNLVEQVALEAKTIAYQWHGAEFLELDIPTNCGKQMVFDSDFATHLKMLNMTGLLDGPMVLLNFMRKFYGFVCHKYLLVSGRAGQLVA